MRGSVAWGVAACLGLCATLAAEPPATDTWTVKKGDTLSKIAVAASLELECLELGVSLRSGSWDLGLAPRGT